MASSACMTSGSSSTVVRHMLSNEKMKGDALIQKSYVADFPDKRQRKNKGEVQQYYVTGGHEELVMGYVRDMGKIYCGE